MGQSVNLGVLMKKLSLVILAVSLGACSTVTRGTTSKVIFESYPTGAYVSTSAGHACETPCVIEIPRKTEFVTKFSKEGYADTSVAVQTRVAGAGAAGFAGNILIGGVVGMGVDAATGSTLEHYPNPVKADLIETKKVKKLKKTKTVAEAE